MFGYSLLLTFFVPSRAVAGEGRRCIVINVNPPAGSGTWRNEEGREFYLVRLWDRPPVDAPDGLKPWDRIPVGVLPAGGLDMVSQSAAIVTRRITFLQPDPPRFVTAPGVQPLSGHYRQYRFDRAVRTVAFRNTIREERILHGTVWAIENIGGTWKAPVDLTEELQKSWCRDERDEDLQELVLVFGNHDWRNLQTVNPREPPTVEARAVGCAGWIGTSTLTNTITSTDPNLRIVETVQTSLHFALDSALIAPGRPHEHWKTVSGSLSWHADVTGDCTGSGQGSEAVPNSQGDHVAVLRIWAENGKLHHEGLERTVAGRHPALHRQLQHRTTDRDATPCSARILRDRWQQGLPRGGRQVVRRRFRLAPDTGNHRAPPLLVPRAIGC